MSVRAPRVVTALLAIGLLATACGASPETEVASDADPATTETATTAAAPTVASTTAPAAVGPDTEDAPTAVPAVEDQPTSVPATPVPPTPLPEPAEPAQVAVQLPDIDVVDLSTGEQVNLAGFAEPGPTLLWFWAPH